MPLAHRAGVVEARMVPLASVVGALLIVVGLWGSVLTLRRER
jgi:hypothetical protein